MVHSVNSGIPQKDPKRKIRENIPSFKLAEKFVIVENSNAKRLLCLNSLASRKENNVEVKANTSVCNECSVTIKMARNTSNMQTHLRHNPLLLSSYKSTTRLKEDSAVAATQASAMRRAPVNYCNLKLLKSK